MEEKEVLKHLESLKVTVVRVDGDEIACLCPVHEDKKPSFFFNYKSEKFNCFVGCLKGRGIHQLAFQLKKTLDVDSPTPLARHVRIEKKCNIPHIPNLSIALGNPGELYLTSRGLTRESIVKWNLLYWPEEDAVIIPIEDVGYIKRCISEKKYFTLPGTRVGSILFGLSHFNSLRGSAILVEGSFDCIAMHQMGFDNTLAILHSDLTWIQYKILQGITSKIYIMLDGDNAGQEASKKIRKMLSSNFIVKVVNLPAGKDPDNLDRGSIISLLKKSDSVEV